MASSSSADAMDTEEPQQQTHAQKTRALQIETLPWVEKCAATPPPTASAP